MQNPSNEFIEQLFPDTEGHKILLWELAGKSSTWFDEPEKAGKYSLNKTDLYIGCGLRKEELGKYKRGGEKDISGIPGFWFDLDLNHGVHAAQALPNLEQGLLLLDEMPLRPSIIINSGGGLQVWWLFKELWFFDNLNEARKARSFLSRWQEMIISSAILSGWALDNTSDLSRILRVPGTLNGKFEKPRKVEYYQDSADDVRYNISDFEQYLPDSENAAIIDMKTGRPATKTDYPDQDAGVLFQRCLWLKHCRDDSKTLPEPEWYAMLSLIGRCKDGRNCAHRASSSYPGYSADETDKKLKQALEMSGPALCSTIERKFGNKWCGQCDFSRDVRTPMQLGGIPDDIPAVRINENPKLDSTKLRLSINLAPEIEKIMEGKGLDFRTQALKLSYRLAEVGWDDQQIADALVHTAVKRQLRPESAKYYGRVIAMSRNLLATNTAEDFLHEEYNLKKQTSASPKDILDAAGNLFGFKIKRFIKYLSDPPSYVLETEMGNINLGDDCISQVKFRRAVAHYGNHVIKSLKSDRWSEVVQMLLNAREEIDIGPEATDEGALDSWLTEYLDLNPPSEVASTDGSPFWKDDKIYIRLPAFQRFIFTYFGENIRRVTLATVMRKVKLHPQTVRASEKVIKCWELPKKYSRKG